MARLAQSGWSSHPPHALTFHHSLSKPINKIFIPNSYPHGWPKACCMCMYNKYKYALNVYVCYPGKYIFIKSKNLYVYSGLI